MLTVAFGEMTKSRTQVQLRYNRFKEIKEGFLFARKYQKIDENIEVMKEIIHYRGG